MIQKILIFLLFFNFFNLYYSWNQNIHHNSHNNFNKLTKFSRLYSIPKVLYTTKGSSEWIDLFSYHVHKNRSLFLSGTLENNDAREIINALKYLDSEDSFLPITLFLDLPQGSVDASLGLYDTIKSLRSKIHTVNIGTCSLPSALILASGADRSTLPSASCILHTSIHKNQGQASDIFHSYNGLTKIYDRFLLRFYEAVNPTKSLDEFKQDFNRPLHISGQELIDYGICDKFWTPSTYNLKH